VLSPANLHDLLVQIEINTAEFAGVLIFLVWVGKHLWHEIRPARRRPKKAAPLPNLEQRAEHRKPVTRGDSRNGRQFRLF